MKKTVLCIAVVLVAAYGLRWMKTVYATAPGILAFVDKHSTQGDIDEAVACLVSGKTNPPIDQVDAPVREAITGILGSIFHCYQTQDFESFVALRRADLAYAADHNTRGADLQGLHQVLLELGVSPSELSPDWLGTLQQLWGAFYEGGPIARVFPETCEVTVKRAELNCGMIDSWDASFESSHEKTRHVHHHLIVTHRLSMCDLVKAHPLTTWFDVGVDYETTSHERRRLVARFVWDGSTSEWFLSRATTIYLDSHESNSERTNLLL
jgi:hypothetical protein